MKNYFFGKVYVRRRKEKKSKVCKLLQNVYVKQSRITS